MIRVSTGSTVHAMFEEERRMVLRQADGTPLNIKGIYLEDSEKAPETIPQEVVFYFSNAEALEHLIEQLIETKKTYQTLKLVGHLCKKEGG